MPVTTESCGSAIDTGSFRIAANPGLWMGASGKTLLEPAFPKTVAVPIAVDGSSSMLELAQ